MAPNPAATVGQGEGVLLAWEQSGIEDEGAPLAALDKLAALARDIGAALIVPIDAASERQFTAIVDTLIRHGVAALPLLALDAASGRGRSPSVANAPAAMLATLASLCQLIEWDGARCLCIAADRSVPSEDAIAALRAALGEPGRQVRVGWLRRKSAHRELPPGADFAVDWPPYESRPTAGQAAAAVRAKAVDNDYSLFATDIARRNADSSPVALSVLWSNAPSIVLREVATRVTGVSPLKIAHAIDSAHRFVRNRAGSGVPFWVLRAAFDPGAPDDEAALPALAADLARAHTASGMLAPVPHVDLPSTRAARIAVVVHLYYPEMWDEVATAIAALPEPCDVFVSCPLRARDPVAQIVRKRFKSAIVFGVRNLGRDVLPFLYWLGTPGIDRYEYVLKLHSKKSVHVVDAEHGTFKGGAGWRQRAFEGLIGGDGHARSMLRALDARPDVGIVAPAGLLYDQAEWGRATKDVLATLCARLSLSGDAGGKFPAGTMFWARLSALSPLEAASESILDFEREAGQIQGTLHHAYERLFPLVAAARGFSTVDSTQLVA